MARSSHDISSENFPQEKGSSMAGGPQKNPIENPPVNMDTSFNRIGRYEN